MSESRGYPTRDSVLVAFHGQRLSDGTCEIVGIYHDHEVAKIDLAHSLSVIDYSYSGFDWGYLGLGPAQTALAILLEATKSGNVAVRFHDPFTRQVVSRLDHNEWWMEVSEVDSWLESQRENPLNTD